MNILSVTGQGVGEWREQTRNHQRVLHIDLDYEHKGIFWLTIQYEKTLLEATNRFSFETLEVLNAVKDIGYLGLELKSSAEVKVIEHPGLEKIGIQKLPSHLFQKSLKPLIYGFKYLKHPYHLTMDIKRHPKVSVSMAVIDSANAISFFTEDGKVVHRMNYEVRNQLKQFLKLRLPEGAELWSIFVGGKPSEPAMEEDVLYIPLIRSQEEGQRLKSFPVEIVYFQKENPLTTYGQRTVSLPEVTEIIVSKILWSLYLPKDYDFLYFGGTMEKERLARGIGPIIGCARSKRPHRLVSSKFEEAYEPPMESVDEEGAIIPGQDKDIWPIKEKELSEFKKFRASREDLQRQQIMEKGFAKKQEKPSAPQKPQDLISQNAGKIVSGYDTAVMSIPIAIPLSGQLYRFAKTVTRQEPLVITMFYTQGGITDSIGWIILLILLGILFVLRKRLFTLGKNIQKAFHSIEKGLARIKHAISKAYDASVTPLILVGFFIVAIFTFHLFLAIFIVLVLLCVMVHQRAYWFAERKEMEKDKSAKKEKLKEQLPSEVSEQPKKKKWLWIILFSLGIPIFIGGFILFLITSRGRYPHYGIIFLTIILGILYYFGLFVLWFIKRIWARKKGS